MKYRQNRKEYENVMTYCGEKFVEYQQRRCGLITILDRSSDYWKGNAANTLCTKLYTYLNAGEYDQMVREYRRVSDGMEEILPEIEAQMILQDEMSLLISGENKREPEELYLDAEIQEEMLYELAEANRYMYHIVNDALAGMSGVDDIVDLSNYRNNLCDVRESFSTMIQKYIEMAEENIQAVKRIDRCLGWLFDWLSGEKDNDEYVELKLDEASYETNIEAILYPNGDIVTIKDNCEVYEGQSVGQNEKEYIFSEMSSEMISSVDYKVIENDKINEMSFCAVDMLIAVEKYVPYIYDANDINTNKWFGGYDVNADLTFGIGHSIKSEEEYGIIQGRIAEIGDDEEKMERYIYELLQEDVLSAMNIVDGKCCDKIELKQNEYDALVMLAYNCASANIQSIIECRDEFDNWMQKGVIDGFTYTRVNDIRVNGLVTRRNNEIKLFLYNDYNYYERETLEEKGYVFIDYE